MSLKIFKIIGYLTLLFHKVYSEIAHIVINKSNKVLGTFKTNNNYKVYINIDKL